tara:strand:+ start:491 stop:1408 length:918 start_codon:yes stop_codon:yes gene_type:complete
MKKTFTIKNDSVKSRVDRWFRRFIGDVPQSFIEKNIRKGKIKVNNKKQKSSYKLKINDEISIFNINIEPNKNKKKIIQYKPSKNEILSSSSFFLENNENFVVINKPSGIAVQSGTKSIRNILDILKNRIEFKNSKPYAVHRIDKDTSGVLIVAKNRKYAQLFTSLFRIRKIHKTYLCVVKGELNNKKGTLINDLIHYENDRKIITKAITHYTVISSNSGYSLIKLNPETGRKHQLRKQLLIHGHPIVGDNKYNFHLHKLSKKGTLMLHAYKLNFSINEIKYNFSVKPPLQFEKFIKEKYLKISQL